MSRYEYRRRMSRRRRHESAFWRFFPLIIGILIILGLIAGGFIFFRSRGTLPAGGRATSSDASAPGKATSGEISGGNGKESEMTNGSDDLPQGLALLLSQADGLAQMYDYDGAIALIKENQEFGSAPEAQEAIKGYEETKATLVRADPEKVTHVFFHSLIMDTSKAFDGDSRQNGYNQMMTTKDEFLKIMESMYERGYVLVRLRDVAYETTDENGSAVFKEGDIMLPPGKKPFVLSQDDVCYYEYMEGDGFASRMVIGEDGKPTCEMKLDDGSTVTGDYDLVPLLNTFIREHPGFSYKGAKGVLAFTGYNGILGYRTASSYSDSPTYEADREMAAKVAQCLRDDGWELASHSWGHRNMGKISMEHFIADTTKWENEVETLTGPTDIILFPFGSDIGDWHPYTDDNQRFTYLKSVGFRYFCNVDSHQYWVQIGADHMRQGRRNLDGYRMYYDLINPESDHLSDLFDVAEVFDPARPTPVPPMSQTQDASQTSETTAAAEAAAP